MSIQDFTSTLLRKNSLRKECQVLSVEDLEKVMGDLEEIKSDKVEAENARVAAEAERQAAIKKIQDQMAALGVSANDIAQVAGGSSSKGKRGAVAAKYRLTDDDGNVHEWSGRGRTPKVFQERIEKGAKKEDFLIED